VRRRRGRGGLVLLAVARAAQGATAAIWRQPNGHLGAPRGPPPSPLPPPTASGRASAKHGWGGEAVASARARCVWRGTQARANATASHQQGKLLLGSRSKPPAHIASDNSPPRALIMRDRARASKPPPPPHRARPPSLLSPAS
jgi:hypothetical protein